MIGCSVIGLSSYFPGGFFVLAPGKHYQPNLEVTVEGGLLHPKVAGKFWLEEVGSGKRVDPEPNKDKVDGTFAYDFNTQGLR